jgi:hypothetical protein
MRDPEAHFMIEIIVYLSLTLADNAAYKYNTYNPGSERTD